MDEKSARHQKYLPKGIARRGMKCFISDRKMSNRFIYCIKKKKNTFIFNINWNA